MSDINVLKEYYVRYLRDVRGSKDSTVNHYLGAMTTISKYLVQHHKIESTIYEIDSIAELEIIREFLFNQPDFIEKDTRGNNMYSAGLNNYLRFANGTEFVSAGQEINQMDIVVPINGMNMSINKSWKRNGIVKKQSIEMAKYKCEVDDKHTTFIAAATNLPYMEGHHSIPMNKQGQFNVSLDVYANIVCLCPVCHRLLHFGVEDSKRAILNGLYEQRSERLANSGIVLSKNEFVEMVI